MSPEPTLVEEDTPDTGHCWTVGDLADWLAEHPRDALVVLEQPERDCDYVVPLVGAAPARYAPLDTSYGELSSTGAVTGRDLQAVSLQPDPDADGGK